MMKSKSIWIEAEDWPPGEWTPANGNTDVVVTLDDDSRWIASFFSYRNISLLIEKNQRTENFSLESISGRLTWFLQMRCLEPE